VRAPGRTAPSGVQASGLDLPRPAVDCSPDRRSGIGFPGPAPLAAINRLSPVSEHGSHRARTRCRWEDHRPRAQRSDHLAGKRGFGGIDLSARSSVEEESGASWKPLAASRRRSPSLPPARIFGEASGRKGKDLRRKVPRVLRPGFPRPGSRTGKHRRASGRSRQGVTPEGRAGHRHADHRGARVRRHAPGEVRRAPAPCDDDREPFPLGVDGAAPVSVPGAMRGGRRSISQGIPYPDNTSAAARIVSRRRRSP